MLLNIFINIIFFIEVLLILSLEKKMWKTYFTPTFFLTIPFTIVWFFTLIFSEKLGFFKLFTPALIIWIIGILFFWIPSFIICIIIHKLGFQFSLPSKNITNNINFKNDKLILYFSFFISILFLFRLSKFIYHLGFNVIGSDFFATLFAGYGFWGHLRVILIPLIVYHIFYFKYNTKYKILILLIFFWVLLLYQVKGWIIVALITSIIIKIFFDNIKINFKLLFISVLIGFFVFFASYYLSIVHNLDNNFNLNFVFWTIKHFTYYLFSGIIGFSEYVKHNYTIDLNYHVILAPLINIWNYCMGKPYVNIINPFEINIGNVYKSNVYSFFGTVYIFAGYYKGILISLYFGFIYYILYLLFLTMHNIWLLIAIFYLMTLLSLGWFEFYLFHFDVIEIPIFCLFLSLLFQINQKFKFNVV